MTNYYVKTTGSDGAAGTSWGAAWATVSKCLTTMVAGDTATFDDGTYTQTTELTPTNSGSAGSGYITLQALNTSGAIIAQGAAQTGSILNFTSKNYWQLIGLKFTGRTNYGTDQGLLYVNNTDHWRGVNLELTSFLSHGIRVKGTATIVDIINCVIHAEISPGDNGTLLDGINCNISSTNATVTISGNEVYHYNHCGIICHQGGQFNVFNNYVHDGRAHALQCGDSGVATDVSVAFYSNDVYNAGQWQAQFSPNQARGFFINQGNLGKVEVYHNRVWKSGGPGICVQNTKQTGHANAVKIVGNTFYDCANDASLSWGIIQIQQDTTWNDPQSVYIRDNIFWMVSDNQKLIFVYYADGGSTLDAKIDTDYNLWKGPATYTISWTSKTYADLSAYKTNRETHAVINSDPLFVSTVTPDFDLQAGSPAIDVGVAVSPYTDGYSGSAPDMGAYEYTASVYVTTTTLLAPPALGTGSGPLNTVALMVYSSGTTAAADPARYLARAKGLGYRTFYPGGLFSDLTCFIPCDPAAPFPFTIGQRIVARNKLTVTWEGEIVGLGFTAGQGAEQGVTLTATGRWGRILETRTWEKRWADNRITDAVWPLQTGASGSEECSLDRLSRIRFTPKGVAWSNNDYSYAKYTMPTGETVKRVTCSYNLQEGGQAWRLAMGDHAIAVTLWSVTASGTGTQDVTLGTPDQSITLLFQAQAGQTPTEGGTYFGEVSNPMVYSETGTITAQSITKNVRAKVTDINSDEANIGAPGVTLEPFISQGRESMASILMRAAAFGDSSYNSWAPYFLESDAAATPDGKPVLALTQYPVLTSFDYAVRLDDANLVAPLTVVQDGAGIFNWITVRYRDQLSNQDIVLTPDDDANLKDTTSITTYGQREPNQPLDAGTTTATLAKALARRYLAAHKDPRFYVSGNITVMGYIRNAQGGRTPASEIRAGKRVKIENYLDDLASVTGAGLTFIVTATDYDDVAETCAIGTGVPDDLAVFLAQLGMRTA